MDVVLEKVSNTEESAIRNDIKQHISDTIRLMARRERDYRESTITIKLVVSMTQNSIKDLIEDIWVRERGNNPVSFWQDKEHVYCKFLDQTSRNTFLDAVKVSASFAVIKDLVLSRNESDGNYYVRKSVRIVLPYVRANVKANLVLEMLEKILGGKGKAKEFKEGKAQPNGARDIFFKIDSSAFTNLFKIADGVLPYSNKETNARVRLYAKIVVRPWQCRDCYKLGSHQCEGKLCANCGQKGHLTKDCKSKTKFCPNCKRRGHKARDVYCSLYLKEVAKELRKYDIPLEFFEDDDLRRILSTFLQYK